MNLAYMVCIATALVLAAPEASARDASSEETQTEINAAAGARLKSAEAEMARVFDALLRHTSKKEAIAKLRKAQAAWQAYRDAQIKALWPVTDPTWYGTAHPMCVAFAKAALTEARTKELREMLSSEEGDLCASEWAD